MTGHLSRKEFLIVKTAGKNSRYTDFSAITNPGTGKYAVVISAKLAKRAVVRNKLRRRIFNILRATKTIDAIIFPNKSMLNLNYAEMRARFDPFLSILPILAARA